MIQMHDPELSIHRHPDGSIDFDHYRTRSLAIRSAAMRDVRTLKAFLQFVAIVTFAVTGAAVVASAPPPVIEASCKHCSQRMVPLDASPAATLAASSPRALRAE